MQIIRTRTLEGPNIFTHRPIVLMTLDLQDLHERDSCDLPGFVERLIERLPGLAEHVCGTGDAGGFTGRLREGTYLGHVVEHVAIEWGQVVGATGNAIGPPSLLRRGRHVACAWGHAPSAARRGGFRRRHGARGTLRHRGRPDGC